MPSHYFNLHFFSHYEAEFFHVSCLFVFECFSPRPPSPTPARACEWPVGAISPFIQLMCLFLFICENGIFKGVDKCHKHCKQCLSFGFFNAFAFQIFKILYVVKSYSILKIPFLFETV